MIRPHRTVIIGAGIAALTAAVDLARSGIEVTVLERQASAGGKLRPVQIGQLDLDAGPTVFTLREIFERLFDDAGESLASHLTLIPAKLLARHVWSPADAFDLRADLDETVVEVGELAGAREARRYLKFARESARVFQVLENSFIRSARPSLLQLAGRLAFRSFAIRPFDDLWSCIGRYFTDPRLRQLFARYATYCGSSPFLAPATLMLIAHVERAGVWYVEGGMHRLTGVLQGLAEKGGAKFRFGSEVRRILMRGSRVSGVELSGGERVECDSVICNADTSALAAGLFGSEVRGSVKATAPERRSLSAVTWNLLAATRGRQLAHHSIFFSPDYPREFQELSRGLIPHVPTVYLCAQDRRDTTLLHDDGAAPAERLLCLINAPAIGDSHQFSSKEIEACAHRVFERLGHLGLTVDRGSQRSVIRTPNQFHQLYPGTGGALYGPASHGWRASFERASSKSRVPGLYLAGGSTHPGAGVPMAALSGRLAAAQILKDCTSTAISRRTAMPGGISTA